MLHGNKRLWRRAVAAARPRRARRSLRTGRVRTIAPPKAAVPLLARKDGRAAPTAAAGILPTQRTSQGQYQVPGGTGDDEHDSPELRLIHVHCTHKTSPAVVYTAGRKRTNKWTLAALRQQIRCPRAAHLCDTSLDHLLSGQTPRVTRDSVVAHRIRQASPGLAHPLTGARGTDASLYKVQRGLGVLSRTTRRSTGHGELHHAAVLTPIIRYPWAAS